MVKENRMALKIDSSALQLTIGGHQFSLWTPVRWSTLPKLHGGLHFRTAVEVSDHAFCFEVLGFGFMWFNLKKWESK